MITLHPIGTVRNSRPTVDDDHWGSLVSTIELNDSLGDDALEHIDDFSHAEVIFFFHHGEEGKVETGARHPRDNQNWPKVGILAQRGKDRPNRLGLTTVKIIRRTGTTLVVEGLDAMDGTPVLDIKPVMKEFLPRGEVHQPAWATELMHNYW
jgi:tRNA-Thr(GGU) m(6)t(6)A37 methyltransferase TsaA